MSNTLVDDLEAAFHACLAAATNPDHFGPRDNHDERKVRAYQYAFCHTTLISVLYINWTTFFKLIFSLYDE